ncbi:hypothetical protein Fmac_031179 [Flemingia macrophylla]|uniref:ABC1 atypical kinase-like domain-containing protein n=1 Tax=Flemingia macrophylla TaxID=520843 RepID=A0ABD1L1S4_9FABA
MTPKPFNFPAKRTTALFLLTASAAAATAAQTTYSADKLGGEIHGLVRTARAVSSVASTVVDYEFSLRGLQKDSDKYRQAISQVHLRSAKRFLKLCEANRGFYVKAGQFAASQKVLPREYSSTLSSLQDQVAPLPFRVIKEVLKDNLGPDFSEMFLSIDEQPIAAASIAQVHHAVLKSGHEVAIKVQYPWIEQQMNFDTRAMYFISKTIAWLYPQYRFEWLPLAFTKSMSSELDFVQEARNSEIAAKNFRNNKMVRIPHVFWDLTTKLVLTMQFYTGHRIGVDPEKPCSIGCYLTTVAKSLTELIAEMIFVHGYIHGDPHPGNIFVSPEVLLDHAVYTVLDEVFRKDFCQLWEALIVKDSMKTVWLGERFGAGKYSRYLPFIFTGTTIESKSALGISIKEKETLKHELKSLLFEDLSSFMESLPSDFIAILRVDALLRSIIRKLDVSRITRLLTYTKYAVYGRLCPKLDGEGESCKILGTNIWTIDVIPWKEKLKSVQNYLYSKISYDSLGFLVHSVFLIICISPSALF